MTTQPLMYHPTPTTNEFKDKVNNYHVNGEFQQASPMGVYGSREEPETSYSSYTPAESTPADNVLGDRRVLNEKKIGKIIRIPKRIIREEIIEEDMQVYETIIEIAKLVETEKIVEVPEVEYKNKIKEVVEHIVEEKIREIPKIEYCERIIEVPKIITQEKIVVQPQIEYHDVITERVVEIPEIHQNVVLKQVEVPTYVDDKGQLIEQPILEVERKIPVPVEAVTTFEYQLAQLRQRVTKVKYPMYVPRFIPVPVPAESIEQNKLREMQDLTASINKLVSPQAMDLHELEDLQAAVQAKDFASRLPTIEEAQAVIRENWLTGQLQVNTADQEQMEQKMYN